jgi:hypothetical protein
LGGASFGPAGGQPFEKVAKHIKIKVQQPPPENLFAPLFKSGPPEAIIFSRSLRAVYISGLGIFEIPFIHALVAHFLKIWTNRFED